MMSSELMHYGVLGMRWGVRKDKDTLLARKSSRTTRGLQRRLNKDEKRAAKGKQHSALYKRLTDPDGGYESAVNALRGSKDFRKAYRDRDAAISGINKKYRVEEARKKYMDANDAYMRLRISKKRKLAKQQAEAELQKATAQRNSARKAIESKYLSAAAKALGEKDTMVVRDAIDRSMVLEQILDDRHRKKKS